MNDVGRDIASREDVERLVRHFYREAFADELIGPIFTEVARMDLDAHMPIMCDFWETVLFRSGAYRRNALEVHFALHEKHPLSREAFDRWLTLWAASVDDLFNGEHADRAKLQAERIAGSIHRRVTGHRPSQFARISSRTSAS